MKAHELIAIGIPRGPALDTAMGLLRPAFEAGLPADEVRSRLTTIASAPESHLADAHFGELARVMSRMGASFVEREAPAPWRQWGTDLDEGSLEQMRNACRLPVAVAGALMPDAHRGYGLPIGGVLATEGAVIPYAVGVDIACRMKLTVVDLDASALDDTREATRLAQVLEGETAFGIGASFATPREHAVMDDAAWSHDTLLRRLKDRARSQLGSSGSGNHFVEWGTLTLDEPELGLAAGTYLALLSHSGSRGAGATVATHYSKLARELHPELPRELAHLAWLDMASEEGQAYWEAMELMGRYAAANHDCVHREIVNTLGVEVRLQIENHHNFAWREVHQGRDVIVHRKGATPAGRGVLGIIPGSMAAPGYVVRGRGSVDAMDSASHGAGRVMSRRKAKASVDPAAVEARLRERRVQVLSAGLDEAPFVYKDIDQVMGAQRDLVDVLGRFDPRIVKMAPPGEPAED